MPEPEYFQVEGPWSEVYPVIRQASEQGCMICGTYSRSPTGRYGGSSIAHMVNYPHVGDAECAVLDNNYIGYDAFEWMTPDELAKASGPRSTWAIIFGNPGPPPAPHNGVRPKREPIAPPKEAPRQKTCSCSPQCTCGCNEGQPCRCGNEPDPDVTGVVVERLSKTPRYWHGGTEVDAKNFQLALSAVPDYARKYRVVAIGPKEQTDRIAEDWKTYPAQATSGYILQTYQPDHWHVADMGYALDKAPAIHVLKPDGTQVEYQEGYSKDRLVSALRRKSPGFKPALPSPLGSDPSPLIPFAAVAAVGVGAYLVLRKKGK